MSSTWINTEERAGASTFLERSSILAPRTRVARSPPRRSVVQSSAKGLTRGTGSRCLCPSSFGGDLLQLEGWRIPLARDVPYLAYLRLDFSLIRALQRPHSVRGTLLDLPLVPDTGEPACAIYILSLVLSVLRYFYVLPFSLFFCQHTYTCLIERQTPRLIELRS